MRFEKIHVHGGGNETCRCTNLIKLIICSCCIFSKIQDTGFVPCNSIRSTSAWVSSRIERSSILESADIKNYQALFFVTNGRLRKTTEEISVYRISSIVIVVPLRTFVGELAPNVVDGSSLQGGVVFNSRLLSLESSHPSAKYSVYFQPSIIL